MKKSKSKTYRIIKCGHCNKKFNKSHGLQKYCSKECIKEVRIETLKKHSLTDKFKKTQKKYQETDKAKETLKKYYKTERHKELRKKISKKYNQSEKGKVNAKNYNQSDKRKETLKRYYKTDKGKETTKKRINRYEHSEKGKTRRKKYIKEKIKTNPVFKIIINHRSRLNKFLKVKNIKKTNKSFKMIGCTPEFLKQHLEKQFKQGMTWKNNTPKGWHVDHRKPISSATTPKDAERLSHYTNLQPMWATENLKKGNKII
jgi:hypothetical protein